MSLKVCKCPNCLFFFYLHVGFTTLIFLNRGHIVITRRLGNSLLK